MAAYETLFMHVCVHACVRLSHFYTNLSISFIYDDIFIKFAENVYGSENLSVRNLSSNSNTKRSP